jgi:hypothetical protein
VISSGYIVSGGQKADCQRPVNVDFRRVRAFGPDPKHPTGPLLTPRARVSYGTSSHNCNYFALPFCSPRRPVNPGEAVNGDGVNDVNNDDVKAWSGLLMSVSIGCR